MRAAGKGGSRSLDYWAQPLGLEVLTISHSGTQLLNGTGSLLCAPVTCKQKGHGSISQAASTPPWHEQAAV